MSGESEQLFCPHNFVMNGEGCSFSTTSIAMTIIYADSVGYDYEKPEPEQS